MIVLSFLLVVIAAVTLLVGLFQDTLTWIWISIGSCVLAMVFLGIGVLQRRSGRVEPEGADEEEAYGPGAISSLITGGDEDEEDARAAASEDVTVVPKRSASDARGQMSRAAAEAAADEAVEDAEEAAAEEAAVAEKASKKTAKKTAKKAARKKTAKKTTKKTAKKATKKTAKKTTGKAARERLGEIKGLGPAKQKALLDAFGSLEAIRDADVAELREVKGIGEATAEAIQEQLS